MVLIMKNYFINTLLLIILLIPSSILAGKRGEIYEYDSGAPKNSRWPDLFAETPNYRSFGKAVIGGRGEKFRWQMGPMWYRGRLTGNSVKILVIGQEGAQDENVTNRSFTGSTGTRMQKFLNYFGVDRSYLFMNTFVYTITGQYSLFGQDAKNIEKQKELKRLIWLAQDKNSIIVKHRHKMFDYALEINKNKLKLVIGVGTAGKDSTATWFRKHGVKCTSSMLSKDRCIGTGKLDGIIAIGVRHPGAASARNAGGSAVGGLRYDFEKKAKIVAEYITGNQDFLIPDKGMKQDFSKSFKYGYTSIPHRDFSFGTNWKMGKRGTSSNRRRANAIQVFSNKGCYNNYKRVEGRCKEDAGQRKLKYDSLKDFIQSSPVEMAEVDVPYESAKSQLKRRDYDLGPKGLTKEITDIMNVDFQKLGVTQDKSFGHTGIYRGRNSNIKVIVIADQMSHTDMFSGRALTGAAGQKLQSFLNSAGISKSYIILRSLPVDTLDLPLKKVREIALNEKVDSYRNKLIKKIFKDNTISLVISVGPIAKEIVEHQNLSISKINLPIADIANKHIDKYNNALREIKELKLSLDSENPTYSYKGKLSIIPRRDLPAYTRWWMGTSGDRAVRAFEIIENKRVDSGDYYKVVAPYWIKKTKPNIDQLNNEELKSLDIFKQTGL